MYQKACFARCVLICFLLSQGTTQHWLDSISNLYCGRKEAKPCTAVLAILAADMILNRLVNAYGVLTSLTCQSLWTCCESAERPKTYFQVSAGTRLRGKAPEP